MSNESRLKKLEDAAGIGGSKKPWIFIFLKGETEGGKDPKIFKKVFTEPLCDYEKIRVIPWSPQIKKWLIENWDAVTPEIRNIILKGPRKKEIGIHSEFSHPGRKAK